MQLKFIFFAFLTVFLAGCSSNGTSGSGGDDEEKPVPGVYPDEKGMLLVEGSKDTVVLGTNKNDAKVDETPEMKVLLDYDYWMDIQKVTCKDFMSVMKESTLAKVLVCKPDSLPIVNVTFFDAVLYANRKSKNEQRDTVYEYSGMEFDKIGRCVNLKGFSFHLDRDGFRLPTEAEWVKAASMKKSRFQDFSGASKEFVNDHKGMLRNSFVINFVGASYPNDINERVVKGWAENAPVNLYSRGDTYPVTPSTHADNVGFRLAIGAIPNAVFLDQKGDKIESPVNKVLTALALWDYTKTSKVKLVFKNEVTGNLNYIDYTKENEVIEIADTIPVYHPDISPDGKRVAFCTGIEGADKTSRLYVRNLDPSGSGLVKLDVKSAAIPRWNVLASGDTVITYVTKAGDNSDDESFKSVSTWQVPFAKGKFGTPKQLFNGAYHGGVSEDISLAVSGSKLLRARVHKKDTIWYNGEQACNVSLAKDYSKRTAFLDFAGKTGESFVGKKYKVHEYLFIADSTGELIQRIGAPAGYVFDHSEWATGRVNQNLVATLTNVDGAHSKIVLIHLDDSTVTSLVEGDELWHPCLWIQGKSKGKSSSSKAVSSSSKKSVSSSSSRHSEPEPESSSAKAVSSSSSRHSEPEPESSSEKAVSSSSSRHSEPEPESSSEKAVSSSSSRHSEPEPESSSENVVSSSSSSDFLIENFELDEDSAGFYVKNNEFQEAHWSYKMELVWTYMDEADVVVFGSSRPHHGIIPDLFSKEFFVVNLASGHGNLHSSHYMAVNYVLPHYKKLKYIIIDIGLDRLWLTKENSFFYNNSPNIKGYVYDANHDFWKSGVPEGLLECTQGVPKVSAYSANLTERGYMPVSGCSSWSTYAIAGHDVAWLDTGSVRLEESLGYLTDIIQLAAKKGIKVVGVEMPLNPNYQKRDAYGKYGLRNSDAPQILDRINALTKEYDNFTFFDEHKMGNHDYLDHMNYDDDHLCRAGAEQITHRLDSLLKTLE